MTTPKVLHCLLTDAIDELDQIKHRLEKVAEMLLEIRGRDAGLDMRSDEERWADDTRASED